MANPDAFQWANLVVPAVSGFVGAVLGAGASLKAAKYSSEASTTRAVTLQAKEWKRQADRDSDEALARDRRYRRELLGHAVAQLLDVLWTKERLVCDALALARENPTGDVAVDPSDPALRALGDLDLTSRADLLRALPYIDDPELARRLESAQLVINAAYNLRASGPIEPTYDHYSRAMIEVQAYFKWLRWNLGRALKGQALPPAIDAPQLRRPMDGGPWSAPGDMPDIA